MKSSSVHSLAKAPVQDFRSFWANCSQHFYLDFRNSLAISGLWQVAEQPEIRGFSSPSVFPSPQYFTTQSITNKLPEKHLTHYWLALAEHAGVKDSKGRNCSTRRLTNVHLSSFCFLHHNTKMGLKQLIPSVSSFTDNNIVCSHFRFILGSTPLENRSGWYWELQALTSNLRHFNLRGFCLKPRTQNCPSVPHPCSVNLSFAENDGRLFHCYSNIKQNKPSAGETPRCYTQDLSSIITNARETVVCSHG